MPAGLQLRAGRFASQIGYLNQQHLHADADAEERRSAHQHALFHRLDKARDGIGADHHAGRARQAEHPGIVVGAGEQIVGQQRLVAGGGNLGEDGGIANDVDVALHELAVSTLLRALGTPYWPCLKSLENRWQFRAVGRVVAG